MAKTASIKLDQYKWYNLNSPTHRSLAKISGQFDLSHNHIKQSLPEIQRPKFIKEKNYIFMVLLYPVFDKNFAKINISEIDFFIGSDYVLTLHQNNQTVENLFSQIKKDRYSRKEFLNHPITLLSVIIGNSIQPCWSILDKVSKNLENLETKIFNIRDPKILFQLLEVKNQITQLKKIMQSQKKIIIRLVKQWDELSKNKKNSEIFSPIIEMTMDIWDNLNTYADVIDTLQQTYESATSYKTNNILYVITVFSAVVFPASLIANILGMNVIPTIYQGHIYTFISLGIMVLISITLFLIFKFKKWL